MMTSDPNRCQRQSFYDDRGGYDYQRKSMVTRLVRLLPQYSSHLQVIHLTLMYPASTTENGIPFEDNSSLEVDIIVLAMGYKNTKVHLTRLSHLRADVGLKTAAEKITVKEAEKVGDGNDQLGSCYWFIQFYGSVWGLDDEGKIKAE